MPAVCGMGDTPHCTTCRLAPAVAGSPASSLSRAAERSTLGGGAAATISGGSVTTLAAEKPVEAPLQGGKEEPSGRAALPFPAPGSTMALMAMAGPQ